MRATWAKISPSEYDTEKFRYITLAELLYLCYFAVMLGAKAIGLYEGQTAYNICLVIGAAFFACKIVCTKHSVSELLIMFLLFALGGAVYLQSGEKSLLIYFTMMLGMKAVSKSRVFKVGSAIWLTSFVSLYVLSVVGVIPEYSFSLNRRGWPIILRHSLGYPHPNTLHASYFVLVAFILYLTRNLSKKYITAISIILLLGNGYVFMYSVSRNGFLVVCIYLVLHIYLFRRTNKTKLENWLLMAILPVAVLFIVFVPLITSGEVFEKINTILAGRPRYTRYYLTYEPLRLFGIENIPVPREDYVIDSSYIYLIFRLGIVAFCVVLALMMLAIYDAIKNNRLAEISLLLAFSIYGMLELLLFNQSYKNLMFIFMGTYLFALTSRQGKHKLAIIDGESICLRFPKSSNEKNPIIPINIWLMSAILLVVVGIITSLVYTAIVPYPSDIYIPRSEEMTTGDGIETYLTSDEVKTMRKDGILIRGYVDENTPVYRMQSSSVARMERIRYDFSYGLWGGTIACLIFLFVWTTKRKLRNLTRNKQVGADYKESVLLVHNYYRIPGGEDIVVANEKKMLESRGHKVVTYFRNNDDVKDGNFLHKIHLAFVALFSFRSYFEICHIVEKEKIDVIHVHNTVALVSPAVYIAGINMGVPVVQTIHNFRLVCPNGVCYIKDHVCERCLEHGLKASLLYNCYRGSKMQTTVCALSIKLQRVLQTYKSIYYICLTEFNKSKLLTVKQIKDKNIYIKPNFTTLESEVIDYSNRKNQIVYAGRLEKIKGLDILLQAWMKLGDKAPKLIICGSGELEGWCHEYIANNEMTNVEMLGQIDNTEAKKLIGESLAMIYPTQWYEGFPMAVAEAYTMGTPIIASDIGNVGSLVVEGVTGMKFKCNSVVSLAKAVESFMKNPVKLPSEYLTMYSEENNYAMLKNIYEDVRKRSF